ncbi:Nitrate/nitrite transporter NarK [Alkalibacterium subtropicum]|uniref:Nitrate/nitrite transporter NarK n=1 Tax=Alkalibacterium subtropicum TaxID=753702 RepID=A0A1I1LG28_9LACT|nr:MFS transporter [Alkalibacterium subtropicum]SFC71999.1 Nitrate/nitrite transporter NarK [Alkalibacterium subtropicum]
MNDPSRTLKHWLVLAIACGMSASAVGITMNVIGVFYTPVAQDLNIYRGSFALHATLASVALAVISLFFTPLLYRYGWKKVLTTGVTLASFSTMAMAFTTQLWVFYILGIIRGIGAGLYAMIPLSMIINNWFEKKKGFAMSLSFGSTGIAGALFSPVFTALINALGWEYSFIVMGLVMIALALPAILYHYELDPKDEDLLPYGYDETEEANQRLIKQPNWTNFSYTNIAFILIFVIAFTHTSIAGISQHLPGYAESNFLSEQVGGILLSAVMIGNITFKLIIGSLSDRLGIVKASVIMLVLTAVSISMLLTLSNTYLLIFSAFLFGTVFTIPAVALPLLTTEFFGKELYVRIYPILSFSAGIGAALSMTLVGYAYDFTGSYALAFTIALVFIAVNIPLLFIAQKHTPKHT